MKKMKPSKFGRTGTFPGTTAANDLEEEVNAEIERQTLPDSQDFQNSQTKIHRLQIMVVCTRSVVLERRPDLPLCGLRRILQLRAGKSNVHDVRDILSSSKGRLQKGRDTRSLLQTPTKVASSEGLPKRDRNAIGKAIVGRPRKDDHWVTTGTAGCTFTAATREFPENFRKPVNVQRLRQVGRGISLEAEARRYGRLSSGNRHARARAIAGLIGPRELALLESHYRLAAAERRAESVAGPSADVRGGERRRRPRPGSNECASGTVDQVEPGGRNLASRTGAHGNLCEAAFPHDGELDRQACEYPTSNTWMEESRRRLGLRSRESPPRAGSAAVGTESPHRLRARREQRRRDSSQSQGSAGDVPKSERDGCWPLRVGKMTPQPLAMGRGGGTPGDGGQEDGGRGAGIHRGVVITDELRKELLNPLAHRFRLLRGAH